MIWPWIVERFSRSLYDRRNGYRQPPESSTYTPEVRAQYRAAQQERHRRLDAKAYALPATQKRARKELESPSFAGLEPTEQVQIRRTALSDRYLIIYRTNADLKFTDLSIDPSDRHVQANPEQANYARGGRAQIMTPRGFLSTWSGLSSRMVTDDNLAKVTVPTLMVVGTADSTCCGIDYYKTSYAASIAKDKQLIWIKGGDHSLVPTEPTAGGRDTQAEGARAILDWLRPRFPA